MLVYQDLLSGDELLSDSFPYKEIENGMLWEAEGKWVVQGSDNVKVVDIVDTFRLQEQPPFDKKQFVTFMKRFVKNLTPKLEIDRQENFKKHVEGATKFLLSKLNHLRFFVGESIHDDGCLVFAYYKDGAVNPTFFYFSYALREMERRSSSTKKMEAESSKKRGVGQSPKKGWSINKPVEMLSPIYHQAGDTCVAIAIVGVIEAIYNMQKNPQDMIVLSVEDMIEWYLQKELMSSGVSATDKVYNHIINSGGIAKTDFASSDSLIDFAIKRQNEIVRASKRKGKERKRREAKKEVSINGYKNLTPKNEREVVDILSHHPVVGIFDVYPSFENLPMGEVYKGPTEEEIRTGEETILHAVQVYGHGGSEETGYYWEVKNSHGPDWSNSGYGRVSTTIPLVSISYPTGVENAS